VVAPAQERGVTSTRRGLVILAAIALLLAIGLVTSRRREVVVDRTVLPKFDPATVRMLTWKPNDLTLERSGQGWHQPGSEMPIVARAVDDVLSSLRSARWHRRADKSLAGALHRTLLVTGHEIEVHDPLLGTEQTWIVVDHGDALLVDTWLAKVLDPDAIAFRDRAPFAAIGNATHITAHGRYEFDVSGPPWRTSFELVNPKLVEDLQHALANLEIVADASTAPQLERTTIELDGTSIAMAGSCGTGEILLVGAAPPACTTAATDVHAALQRLMSDERDMIDPHVARFAIDEIRFRDGVLALGNHPTVAINGTTMPADPDRVADLVHSLAMPGAIVERSTTPIASLGIDRIALEIYPTSVWRHDEPFAIAITPEQRALFTSSARSFTSSERWTEEPATISQLVLDHVTYRRGAVIGEWSRVPAGRFDPQLVEALGFAVAKLHAPSRSAFTTPVHELDIAFAPPVGPTVTHSLAVGSATADGCPARIDGAAATAPLALCTAIAALAR
jgi:hypothetical protein